LFLLFTFKLKKMILTDMQLRETRVAIERAFTKPENKVFFANATGGVGAIAKKQTATIRVLEDFVDKKVQVRFTFIKPAPIVFNDVAFEKGDDFENVDAMPTSVGYSMEITESRKATIAKIPESQVLRQTDVTVGELLAVQVAASTKDADMRVARKFYTKIKENAGQLRVIPAGITYDAVTKTHFISETLWQDIPRLMAVLNAIKRGNPIGNPFMICGEDLAIARDAATTNKGNADGSGLNAAFLSSDIIVGGAPMQSLNENPATFYLVDTNSYAFVFGNKYKEPTTIVGDNLNRTMVRTPSAVFDGAYYDLITTRKEFDGEIFFMGAMRAYHEVIVRPVSDGDTLTGFYKFAKGN
jgi:hypothetical protein